ncbi:cyclin-dependent kinase 8-like [Epinephelus lanceolatus]
MASYDGKGATAKVYKEMYNGQWAAMKKVHGNWLTREDMDREYKIYKKAVHPNIVKLLGRPIMHHDLEWHIPMEYIFGENLEKIIFHPRNSSIKLNTTITREIITGMCEGLFHLHNNDIVHQDLKPDNIMVEGSTFRAVIIDLDFAKFYRDGLNSAQDRGNLAYAAPEIRRIPPGQRDQRSDVWAMGKIIAELLSGNRLHHTSPAYIQDTLRGNLYCDVVARMLDGSPVPRATMAEVIDEIREAGRVADRRNSMSSPPYMSVQQYQSSGEMDSGFGSLGLPPNFHLPHNLPSNGTVEFNYAQFGHGGKRKSTIQGEVRIRGGRPLDAWWTRVTSEDRHALED